MFPSFFTNWRRQHVRRAKAKERALKSQAIVAEKKAAEATGMAEAAAYDAAKVMERISEVMLEIHKSNERVEKAEGVAIAAQERAEIAEQEVVKAQERIERAEQEVTKVQRRAEQEIMKAQERVERAEQAVTKALQRAEKAEREVTVARREATEVLERASRTEVELKQFAIKAVETEKQISVLAERARVAETSVDMLQRHSTTEDQQGPRQSSVESFNVDTLDTLMKDESATGKGDEEFGEWGEVDHHRGSGDETDTLPAKKDRRPQIKSGIALSYRETLPRVRVSIDVFDLN